MQTAQENPGKLDLNTAKKMKADFIRAIQSKEGNFPCFETEKDFCSQVECCWRSACLSWKNAEKK
jgi:hypothetical protein